jgi:hypothetical protein
MYRFMGEKRFFDPITKAKTELAEASATQGKMSKGGAAPDC